MPYIPNPKGDFLPPVWKTNLQLRVQGSFFSNPALRKSIGEAKARALSKVGLDMRQAVKQAIGSRAPKVTNKWKKANSAKNTFEYKGGLYRNATPNAAKPRAAGKPMKSWNPKRWTYYGIRFYYDKGRGTAVVGPDRTPWLYRLHEFGGTQRQTAYAMGRAQAELALKRRRAGRPISETANGLPRTGVILWSSRKIRTGGLWKPIGSRLVRYPARPYVGSDLVARRIGKVREKFRNTLKVSTSAG